MLKLVSNKDGVEIHTLQIENGVATIEPEFEGIQDLLQGLTDKQQILNALSQFNSEYVWAVTYETPPMPALTRRQFKLALLENSLLETIESAISTIEDSYTRTKMQIEYSESTEFHRNSESILYMCELLKLTSEQVDAMWQRALKL